MRRPKATAAQRKHARLQRVERALKRAAARYALTTEVSADERSLLFADLVAQCDRLVTALGDREARKLAGIKRRPLADRVDELRAAWNMPEAPHG